MAKIRRPINLANVDPGRPIADHPVNRGTVAWWMSLANNDAGSTLCDLTGRYHGTLPGAPSSGAGIVRRTSSRDAGYGELVFDEISQQSVSLPDMTQHFAAEEATLSCWIRFRSESPDAGLGTSGGLFDFGASDLSKQIAFPFSDGNIYVSTFDSGRPISGVPKPSNLTSWNHLAFSSADGTNNYKMYWNGVPYAPATTTRTGFYMPAAPNIGKDHSPFFFDGWMDDFHLWNRAIGDDDIAYVYRDSLARYPTLLNRRPAYFTMASSSTAIDATGSLAVDDLTLLGSSQATVFATGSLSLDDLTASATAGVTVGATGSLSLDSIVTSGSSQAVVSAAGSLSIDALTASGSASISIPTTGGLSLDALALFGSSQAVVFAAGALDVDALTLAGSAGVGVGGSGSLAFDDLAASGSAGVSVAATGSLAIDAMAILGEGTPPNYLNGVLDVGDIVVRGSTGSVIDATGSLVLDDLTAKGASVFYLRSDPFAAYLTTCSASASGDCDCQSGD